MGKVLSENSGGVLHEVKGKMYNTRTNCFVMIGDVCEIVMDDYNNIYDRNNKLQSCGGAYSTSRVSVDTYDTSLGNGISGIDTVGFRFATRNQVFVDY